MSVRYAPIPNPRTDPDANPELDAAFDDDDDDDVDESHLLTPHRTPSYLSIDHNTNTTLAYDFNTPVADWDQPPPGSPPPASSLALPNSIGNSNGIVPTSTHDIAPHAPTTWWSRATAFFPAHYVSQFSRSRLSSGRTRIMGGGVGNDGVFSNVSAKPTASGTRVQEGDNVYIVPEESSSAAPPSYAAAQADAAPPYHTSLVLLPPSALYDTNALSGPPTQGSVIVDSLPTGTLFAFLWNTLVSTTFQFVGFVLTWVMHTTHAAKFGSRAGLGITLIQWGFALRARLDDVMNAGTETWEDGARLTFGSTKEAENYYDIIPSLGNSTTAATTTQSIAGQGESQWSNSFLTGPIATEWLSFFLMTIGWFLLLTSSLGFWRVKRWERSILASHASNSTSSSRSQARTQSDIVDEEESSRQSIFERIGLFRNPTRYQPSEFDGGVGTGSDAALSAENSTDSGHQQKWCTMVFRPGAREESEGDYCKGAEAL
ncbi:hypothetical protein J3R82DRAFT_4284 [Butyriboletus roseoflavus]|nr:hypothetical protein J3R82DRAFT_4284 [Butyriboletus roseoflavus]